MDSPERPSLIEFPCSFPIKVMGAAREDFAATIAAIVTKHAPDYDATLLHERLSSGGAYVSVTCVIQATSQAQLDDLYRALSSHPWVRIVL